MPDPIPFATRRIDSVLVIRLQKQAGIGSLDLVAQLPGVLSDPQADDVRHVVVDCTKLRFAGSVFLESLVQLHHRIQERDGLLVLCGVNDELRDILDLARFDTLWDRYASVDDAVQALAE